MFGGLVETTGIVQELVREDSCIQFIITPKILFSDIQLGDSISVNGVCLTVTQFTEKTFSVTAVPETLRVTNLGLLTENSVVNLERALPCNARLGGHYVQGHVDAIATIDAIKNEGSAWLVTFCIPMHLTKYIVKKGYIAIDGMSITIVDVGEDWFSVTMIPHTQSVTIVEHYKVGNQVNIEVDILGKYIEKLLGVKTA